MNRVLVLFHLLAVIVWIGGMFFAHVCLRPVAAAQLPPPQRLPLLAAILGRFFGVVGWALVLLWGSGIIRFAQVGAAIPAGWLAMTAIRGLVLTNLLLGVLTVVIAVLGGN